MYVKGILTTWNDDKGFGFITPNEGGKQIFIHAIGFCYQNKRPVINQRITYSLSLDKERRLCAIEAGFDEATIIEKTPHIINATTFIFPASFIFFIGLMAMITELPMLVFYYYVFISLVTFFVYGADKNSAREKQRRTPENTLHILSLIGGWPGALFAQQKFRHKTKKPLFLLTYWITVLINCAVFIWLLTSQGLIHLNSFLHNFF